MYTNIKVMKNSNLNLTTSNVVCGLILFSGALTGCLQQSESKLTGESSLNAGGRECACDASVTKRAASTFQAGGLATWEILVDWQGAEYCGQEQLCIVDKLPSNQSFFSNNASWDCSDDNGEVTCCATDFDPTLSFGSHALKLEVLLNDEVEEQKTKNCVEIDIVDFNSENNRSCAETEIWELPKHVDLSIEKGIEGTPIGGDMGYFYFVVSNNGTGNANGVLLTDVLPSGMSFDDGLFGDWYCEGDDNSPETVSCTYLSSLAPGGSDTLVLPVHVAMPSEEQITGVNCVSVKSAENDINFDDNESCVDYEIEVPEEECGNCIDDDGDGEIDEDCEFELALLFTADDEMELFIDGNSQGSYLGWSTSDSITTTITSGTHYIAAHAYDVGGAINGFRAQISLDGNVLARSGDGSFRGSNSYPGVGWETSINGLSANPNLCTYSSGWNINPATLEAAGTDWIWFSDSSTSCNPYSAGSENYIVYSFETCPSTNPELSEE